MASGSFLKHLNELDFTDEEQSMIFTPSIQWESTTEEADLFIIKKVISFETIDDLVVYERLPTLCHGCDIIGHSVEFCPTFKLTKTLKLQYGDWICYISPKKQETISRYKGCIRYLDVVGSATPKTTTNVAAPTIQLVVAHATQLAAATAPQRDIAAHAAETCTRPSLDNKAVAANAANVVQQVDAPILRINNFDTIAFDNVGLHVITTPTLPTNVVEELDNDMGKPFLSTSVLFAFEDWFSKETPSRVANSDKGTVALIPCGAKRCSSMQEGNKLNKPRPPPPSSKTRVEMSSAKTLWRRLIFNSTEENENSLLKLSGF
ncbi:hypothetical protein V6N12_010181 [Hibiscus sabdariffa]|uniref:Zinc knuckle CX2CX4HX4C domain-containing protein n=1 Tax=Hibiscus sabdariffa TaxID=183260 RepID=A0ABR2ECY4_9ROSI